MDLVFVREKEKKSWVLLYLIKLKKCQLQKEIGSSCQQKEMFTCRVLAEHIVNKHLCMKCLVKSQLL